MSVANRAAFLALSLCLLTFLAIFPNSSAQITQRPKFFLFISGFVSSTSGNFAFTTILEALIARYPDATGLWFSYTGPGQPYTGIDTLSPLSGVADLVGLHFTRDGVSGRDVYIISHSEGGVVASLYASRFSGFSPDYDARLAGIVVLDSPVQGINDQAPCFPSFWAGLAPFVLGVPIDDWPAVRDMRPESSVIRELQRAAQRVRVTTVTSRQDCFIPPEIAWLL